MPTLTRKPLSWFKTDPNQPRKHFDAAELQALGNSLKIKQLQPVVARSDGTLEIGERRYRAAGEVGVKELDVIITDEELSETEIRIYQLMENIHRVELSDPEKCSACEELVQLNPGWTNKDLATRLNLTVGTITKYRSAYRCIPQVKQALDEGRIGITAVYEISRAEPAQQADLLTRHVAGLSRDGLSAHIRKQKKAATPQIRTKRIACPLPSGVSITASGQELSLDDFIEALGEAQKEARKAREQGLDSRTFGAVMKDKARKR